MAGSVAHNGCEAELIRLAGSLPVGFGTSAKRIAKQPYEAAAPTAGFRAGGVQRNAAPNLFQTLIAATADVR